MLNHFILYSCCIPVKGYLRSALYDLQRKNYLFIPNSLFDILVNHSGETVDAVLELVDNDEREQTKKYFKFLIENEFLFLCSKEDLACFPSLTLSWESSSEIDSIIIDVNEFSNYGYTNIVNVISNIKPKVIQIRILCRKENKAINEIINTFSNTDTKGMEVVFFFNKEISIESIKEIIERNSKITTIAIINSPKEELINYKQAKVIYTTTKISSESRCGIIDKAYFICSLNTYNESQFFNTCLNKKISIDVKGNIKSCPSCSKSFGNIRTTTLNQVLDQPEFKKHWNITKDQIDVCKECEFRHMCTDCRAYIKDPNNIYSQPAKCNYNPYIAKWKGEEGYVPVEECGTYSKETRFIVNKEKVEALNFEIWGS